MTRQQKVAVGAALIIVGSRTLYVAYEGSGAKRPFWIKLLPGA